MVAWQSQVNIGCCSLSMDSIRVRTAASQFLSRCVIVGGVTRPAFSTTEAFGVPLVDVIRGRPKSHYERSRKSHLAILFE